MQFSHPAKRRRRPCADVPGCRFRRSASVRDREDWEQGTVLSTFFWASLVRGVAEQDCSPASSRKRADSPTGSTPQAQTMRFDPLTRQECRLPSESPYILPGLHRMHFSYWSEDDPGNKPGARWLLDARGRLYRADDTLHRNRQLPKPAGRPCLAMFQNYLHANLPQLRRQAQPPAPCSASATIEPNDRRFREKIGIRPQPLIRVFDGGLLRPQEFWLEASLRSSW